MIGRLEFWLEFGQIFVRIETILFFLDRIVVCLVFGVRQIQFAVAARGKRLRNKTEELDKLLGLFLIVNS